METPLQRTLRLLTKLSGFFEIEGIGILMQSHYDNLKRYFNEPHRTVWTNLAMPNEIFHAMNLPTVFTENISAILSAARQSVEPLKVASENIFSSGFCTYITCSIGVLQMGYLPPPKVFVIPSHICEDTPKVVEYLSRKYNRKFFYIDIPYSEDEISIDYIAKQFEEMVDFLEKNTGSKLKPDRLIEAFRLSNLAREYARKYVELRKNSEPLMYGSSGLRLLGMISKFGSEVGVEIIKNIYEELKKRKETGESPVKNRKYRILWLHLYPYYQSKMMRYLEDDLDAVIVAEEMLHIIFEPLDVNDPYRSLAKKILGLPSHGPIEKRINNILYIIEQNKIDGVIHFSHLGCKVGCGGVQFIRDALKKINIPFLELTGDNIDFRNYSEEQIKVRLEAFIEILKEKIVL